MDIYTGICIVLSALAMSLTSYGIGLRRGYKKGWEDGWDVADRTAWQEDVIKKGE